MRRRKTAAALPSVAANYARLKRQEAYAVGLGTRENKGLPPLPPIDFDNAYVQGQPSEHAC